MASAATTAGRDVAEAIAPQMYVRLCLLKGKFLADDPGGGEGGVSGGATAGATAAACAAAAMDAAVWSRMPEDLMWRVVLLLPAAKHFQLHLVSRRWRQVLTSTDFRKRVVATAAAAAAARSRLEGGAAEQPQHVIACVMCGVDTDNSDDGNGSSSKMAKNVDIDLSFVPTRFWKSDSYTVDAAADGLVCICNDNPRPEDWEPGDNQFCVINPLTRTCRVLPKLPFSPWGWLQSTAPLAVTSFRAHDDGNLDWTVATLDLREGGGGQWTVVDGLVQQGPGDALLAVCNGEAYLFCDGKMQVRCCAAAAASGSRATVTCDGPEFLELHWLPTSSFALDHKCAKLVAHRGSLSLVAELVQLRLGPAMVCGVWRLVRSRLKWEAVAGLELEELHRLTLFRYAQWRGPKLFRAQGAGDLLCCTLGVKCAQDVGNWLLIIVGFSPETGTWELLHDQLGLGYERPLELRPDSFLF